MFSTCQIAKSDPVVDERRLPGHLHSETEAIGRCLDVAVVTVLNRGRNDIGAAGVVEYTGVQLRIEKSLKGKAHGDVDCEFDRRDWPETVAEEVPSPGERYIVFMNGSKRFSIVRFSAFSEKHVGDLEEMIAALEVVPAK